MLATTLAPETEQARRRELAGFLRTMRQRLNPAEIGLVGQGKRRTPGLLREEVAAAAGISTTWYVWLEQARPVRPSPRALDGLARALRLDSVARAYMFRLARPDLQPSPPSMMSAVPTPALVELLHVLAPHPAYAINVQWDVVAWNRPAAVLFGGFDLSDKWSCNILARLFLDPRWRDLFPAWEAIVRSSVGQFRSSTTELAATPEYTFLVAALRNASPEFAALWDRQEVFDPLVWRKTFHHQVAGELTFSYSTFRPEGENQEFRLTVYTPVDPKEAQRFRDYLSEV